MILVSGYEGFIGKKLCKKLTNWCCSPPDICTPSFHKVEGVIHLAAISSWKDAERDKVECVRVNVLGTATMLEYARLNKAWFIYVTTTEEHSFYSLTKRMGEELCHYYATNYGMKVVVLRLGNIYGGGSKRYVSMLMKKAREGKQVRVKNPNWILRPIHISKVVEKVVWYATHMGEVSGYQVESVCGERVTSREFMQKMRRKYGKCNHS